VSMLRSRTHRSRTLRAAAATTGAALVLAMSACGQIYPSSAPAQGPAGGVQPDVSKVVVGFAQQQLQAPYFAAMQVQSEDIARQKGFKLLFQAANKDPAIQLNQMQAMMAQGANVLVVNATSVKGQKEMMTQVASKIPVIYIDTGVPGTGTTSVKGQKEMMTQVASKIPVIYIDTGVPGTGTTSVSSDNLTIGRESGKITAKRFLDMGKKSIKMVILTGPATDEFVGPNRRQGFLDGLKEGGLQYEIKGEQSGDYAQDKGQVAAENMLAANPDTDLVLGLNDSMALGGYNVVNGQEKYKNVYVAASADGQREALALIKSGGCQGRYISTGLNSPSLAAEQALGIAVDIATGVKKPSDYPAESFTKAVGIGCENIDEYYDPKSVF
jgi:ribose transport system substrate-binding protein